jgi:hypothetical protein
MLVTALRRWRIGFRAGKSAKCVNSANSGGWGDAAGLPAPNPKFGNSLPRAARTLTPPREGSEPSAQGQGERRD